MSQNLRKQALSAFKSIHQTRKTVFFGDQHALTAARLKINEEYRKCKNVKDRESIEELIAHSRAVEDELRKTVIQAVEKSPGNYEAQIRDEIIKLDNVPFKDCQQNPT